MKYAVVFGTFAATIGMLGVAYELPAWLWAWPAASSAILGAAYGGLGPGVLGKRADGRFSWRAWLLLWPALLAIRVVWELQRLTARDNASDEVAPGLRVGRRPKAGEVPEGTAVVVDMTAELSGNVGLPAGAKYVNVPTLDGTAPDEAKFREVLEEVAKEERPVFVHCAVGRGRSAMMAAAILLRRGVAKSVEEAEALLRSLRASVRLKPEQRELLRRIT